MGFDLGFDRKGKVDRHLVAIEVGVEPTTNQWVNLSEQWLYYKAKNEWFPSVWGDGLNTLSTVKRMMPYSYGTGTIYPFTFPYEWGWIYNASIYRINNEATHQYSYSCTGYGGEPAATSPCSDTTHQGAFTCSGSVCGYHADEVGYAGLTNKSSSEIWGFLGSKDLSILIAKAFLTVKTPLVLSYSVTSSYSDAFTAGLWYTTVPHQKRRGEGMSRW